MNQQELRNLKWQVTYYLLICHWQDFYFAEVPGRNASGQPIEGNIQSDATVGMSGYYSTSSAYTTNTDSKVSPTRNSSMKPAVIAGYMYFLHISSVYNLIVFRMELFEEF